MGNATESRVPGLVTRSLTACLLALFVFSTFLGNALVCAAVVRFRHLRSKVAYVFVMSLAVSDLFVATLVMPWRAVTEVAGFWPFGSFCEVWVAFDIMCSTASILNLCIISVDRYWAIANPFNYEQKMTCQAALIMIAVAWTLSILISFIPVQLNWHKAQGIPLDLRTTESVKRCDTSLNRTYAITSSLISFYIPVAIMIVTYTRIFFIVQKQIRRISTQECTVCHAQSCQGCSQVPENRLKTSLKKETIVLKTLTIIMGAFVCCWLPFFILNCMVPFCNPGLHHSNQLTCVSETTFDVFVWFGWANSTLNPVVYAAFNADFRRAFSVLLGCEGLCSRTRVETVNFSNELVSYHHDTTNPQDPQNVSQPYLLPHAVRESNDKDVCFDAVSEMVEVKGENKLGYLLTDSLLFLNHETELSLDKITPFTPALTPPCMAHVTHNPKVISNVSGIL